MLFAKIENSCGFPGYFSCEFGARYTVPLPFRTTNTSSHECLCIGVPDPGESVCSQTSTCKASNCITYCPPQKKIYSNLNAFITKKTHKVYKHSHMKTVSISILKTSPTRHSFLNQVPNQHCTSFKPCKSDPATVVCAKPPLP